MSAQEHYCQFCRETHPVTYLDGLPFPMVACPLMPPDRALIVPSAEGVASFTWEPDDETQTPPPRYNPDERVSTTIERPTMTELPEEPDFAVAARRGIGRRRGRPRPPANVSAAVNDAHEGLVRDELDRLLTEDGSRIDLPSGCGREVDAVRAQLVTQATDEANENHELTWRHLLEEDLTNVLAAAGPDELMLALVRSEARLRQWRLAVAAKLEPEPEPEQPAEEPDPEQEQEREQESELEPPQLTHLMEGDATAPLCRADPSPGHPILGTDRPELVTCDACKTLFEARFG